MSQQKLAAFKEIVQKINHYHEALSVLFWDLRTGAPKKGVEGRSEVIGMLSTEQFNLSTSDQLGECLDQLSETSVFEGLSNVEQRMVTEYKKDYDRNKKIPVDLFKENVILTSQSESVWEEAKEKSDFSLFQPYLEKVVQFKKQFIEYWGVKGTPYDTLLDIYEPDITAKQLDQVFGSLREKLVPLVAQIGESSNKPNTSFLHQSFSEEKQREFSLFILEEIGYDLGAGRLDKAVHPFMIDLNLRDIRITTNYYPNDITFSLFSSLHEGGHALYEQNISPDLIGTGLCTGASMGIHESQSRFWENMIGRSLPFWKRYYNHLNEVFPQAFSDVSVEDFYRGTNEAKPSLIRIEADELTYNLHVMIRYELEKALFNEDLKVADLPQAWNEKYTEYLGVTPSHDGEGVLQDVHWSGGDFGYFPSYSLGNIYAAQFMNTIQKQLPDFDTYVENGNLQPIKQWLTENIYQYGKLLTPAEILKQVTEEDINPNYLIQYLETKFKGIYGIN
ncbi:carboxypeptidase M32 [Chengkuizengella axinellae]|uniref:Metal-dependent carboxypeptidase n=1 Tax=Chengkuizengella axinellae TaxID=3064388 RepID=A0ABT9IXB7_9BACL|nr:carboxypeptidase M32 [Chengkuizengella sp. 2205SS18-9]MDP5273963.1 carboxypeptidase M32 [Chengkuizengella sp. 2205SS18-9]